MSFHLGHKGNGEQTACRLTFVLALITHPELYRFANI